MTFKNAALSPAVSAVDVQVAPSVNRVLYHEKAILNQRSHGILWTDHPPCSCNSAGRSNLLNTSGNHEELRLKDALSGQHSFDSHVHVRCECLERKSVYIESKDSLVIKRASWSEILDSSTNTSICHMEDRRKLMCSDNNKAAVMTSIPRRQRRKAVLAVENTTHTQGIKKVDLGRHLRVKAESD
jgi:hypothetical protein